MLPRLEAERELASINAMSAAFGGMSRGDRQRYVGRLAKAAQGGGQQPQRATPETLAAMGVAVIVVPADDAGGLANG
jgi:hypothetical protein